MGRDNARKPFLEIMQFYLAEDLIVRKGSHNLGLNLRLVGLERGACDMAVFGICQFFGRYFSNLNKSVQYSVFQSPNC